MLRTTTPGIEICEGVPHLEKIGFDNPQEKKLIIIEDMQRYVFESDVFAFELTHNSHHMSTTYLISVQNYFYPGPRAVTIRRQLTDIMVMVDRSSAQSHEIMSRQLIPSNPKLLTKALSYVSKLACPYKLEYVAISLGNRTTLSHEFMVRSMVLPMGDDKNVRPLFFT